MGSLFMESENIEAAHRKHLRKAGIARINYWLEDINSHSKLMSWGWNRMGEHEVRSNQIKWVEMGRDEMGWDEVSLIESRCWEDMAWQWDKPSIEV